MLQNGLNLIYSYIINENWVSINNHNMNLLNHFECHIWNLLSRVIVHDFHFKS